MHLCKKCNQTKPLSEFYQSKNKIVPTCKLCRAASEKTYRENNKEKIKLAKLAYREKNIEKISENERIYKAKNKERIAEYWKKYSALHPRRKSAAQ